MASKQQQQEYEHFAPLSADITGEQSPLGPQRAEPNPYQAPASQPVERSATRSSPRETEPPTNNRPRHRLRPIEEMPDEVEGSRMTIDKAEWPEGFSLQWVTTSVYGQPQPSHSAGFYRRGWEPVHAADFAGRFEGRWTPPGHEGPIEVDGMILCARDARWSEKARKDDARKAQLALAVKEAQLKGGQIEGVSMDGGARHPSALASNKIRKSYERLSVPKDE
jgi:3',5'-cyclic AMP phosphodiesterase CpdA